MMKRLLLALVAVLCLNIAASARGKIQGWAVTNGQSVITSGISSTTKHPKTVASATITVYTPTGTTNLATIYSDVGGTAKANPFTAATDGFYGFYTDATSVDVRISGGGITPYTISDVPVTAGQVIVTAESCGIFGVAHGGSPTDETTSLNTCLANMYSVGGGTLLFSTRKYRFDSSIVIPNDGAGTPSQPSFRLTGMGSSPNGQGGVPVGGTIIDLRYNGANSKIDTRGLGGLEIDHITFVDGGVSSSVPFLQTTNTTLHIHNNVFYGNTANTPTQDAIVLGNTSTVLSGNFNAPFQGYGTVIENNFFNNIQRGVYGRTYANNIIIQNNTWWTGCGGGATVGAVAFLADITNSDTGNYIHGNLVEMGNYVYGMYFAGPFDLNNLGPNGFFDAIGGTTLAYYRFETDANFNIVIDGYRDDAVGTLISETGGSVGTTTVQTMHQSQRSKWPGPWDFLNEVKSIRNNAATWIIQDNAGNQAFQIYTDTVFDQWSFRFLPFGGSARNGMRLVDVGATRSDLEMLGTADNRIQANAGDLRLLAFTGGTLWLGTQADNTALLVSAANVTTTKQIISSLATGTAPFSITSTTPVANLTLTSHPQVLSTAGALQTSSKLVSGTATLSGGTLVVTFTGAAVFANTSYVCTGANQTNANAFKIVNTSASSITITGTGSDVIGFHCIGQ